MKSSNIFRILEIQNKRNIAIIGHMGSGKSIIASKLSQKFKILNYDSDQEIVKFEKKLINKIFEENGEKYFRNIEKKILERLLIKKNIIISLGGGSILDSEIRKLIRKYSISVFLDVDMNILANRLGKSRYRPLLKNVNIKKKLKDLDIQRRKYYQLANITIQKTDTVADTIKNFIEKFSKLNEEKNTD